MPTYEYRCLDCQQAYEKREGFDAPALQKCPTCGGTARRVIHAPPVVFKGSGFYITDSRSAPAADAEAKTEPAASKPSKAGESSAPEAPPKADAAAAAS